MKIAKNLNLIIPVRTEKGISLITAIVMVVTLQKCLRNITAAMRRSGKITP